MVLYCCWNLHLYRCWTPCLTIGSYPYFLYLEDNMKKIIIFSIVGVSTLLLSIVSSCISNPDRDALDVVPEESIASFTDNTLSFSYDSLASDVSAQNYDHTKSFDPTLWKKVATITAELNKRVNDKGFIIFSSDSPPTVLAANRPFAVGDFGKSTGSFLAPLDYQESGGSISSASILSGMAVGKVKDEQGNETVELYFICVSKAIDNSSLVSPSADCYAGISSDTVGAIATGIVSKLDVTFTALGIYDQNILMDILKTKNLSSLKNSSAFLRNSSDFPASQVINRTMTITAGKEKDPGPGPAPNPSTCATPAANTPVLIAYNHVAGNKVKIEEKQVPVPNNPNPADVTGLEAIFTEISASSGDDKTIETNNPAKWKHIVQYKAVNTACLPNGGQDPLPDFADLPVGKGIILPVSDDSEIVRTPGLTELPDKLADVVALFDPGNFGTTRPRTYIKTFFLGDDMVSIINSGQVRNGGGVAGEHLFYVCVQKTNGLSGALPDALLDCYMGGSFDASTKNFSAEFTHEMPFSMSARIAPESADTSTLADFSANLQVTPDGILSHSEPWSVTAVSWTVLVETTPVNGKAIETSPRNITIAYNGVSTGAKDETTLDIATPTKWDKVLDFSFKVKGINDAFDLYGITIVSGLGAISKPHAFKVTPGPNVFGPDNYMVQDFRNYVVRSLFHLGTVGNPGVNVYLGCIADVLDNSNNGYKLGLSTLTCYVGADEDISTLSPTDATSFSGPTEIAIVTVYPTANPGATDTEIFINIGYPSDPYPGSGVTDGYSKYAHYLNVRLSPDLSSPP